jgi:LysR family hydrogen peroxide-inducible transcriptional activator
LEQFPCGTRWFLDKIDCFYYINRYYLSMNLRDLQYLVALAETGHMGRASEQCHVSQPTMSMQLKKLQDWLNVPLFERRGKVLHLTPHGAALADRARRVVQEADALVLHAKTLRDPLAGEFRLGAFPTLAPYYLPQAMPKLVKAFPKLRVLLVEDKTERLLTQLREGTLDAALLALPVQGAQLAAYPLFEEPFLLALPKTHRLAKRKPVTAQDLSKETVLLLEDGHCLREQALAVCHVMGITENQGFRATSLETLRQMVASGAGVTLMPKCAATPSKQLAYVPFAGNPYTRQIGIVARETSPRRAVIHAMAMCLQRDVA